MTELIREAVAATRWRWPEIPPLGMVTFVDPGRVERKREPGRVYRLAGFRRVGRTRGGLHVWQLLAKDMPQPSPPLHAEQLELLLGN